MILPAAHGKETVRDGQVQDFSFLPMGRSSSFSREGELLRKEKSCERPLRKA
jgi:hypothetical protein